MLTSAVIFLSFSLRLSLLSYLRCRRLPHHSPQRQLYQPLHRRLTYLVVKNSKNKQTKGQRLVQREEEEEHNWRQPQLYRFGEPHKTEALTRLQVGRWKAHVDYIVLTSVDRDDLPDGGSGHFAQTVKTMKQLKPEIMVECLTSDFRGDLKAVDALVHLGLDVFAHNIETVKRLLRIVRDPRAGYAQSLSVLRHAKINKEGMITKSSIMLGLGESDDELKEAMADLRAIDVDILTLGQYLQPTPLHLTVKEYVTPEKFAFWKEYKESIGFRYVASGTTGPILI